MNDHSQFDLTPDQRELVDQLLSGAVAVAPSERESYVSERCSDDEVVLKEVMSLLGHFDSGETADFLDQRVEIPGDLSKVAAGRTSIPKKVGKYTIKQILGTGGMGAVYLAMQESPRRRVAIKMMRKGITSRSALRRFEFESQLLARLRHQGIAQVYEAGTHDDGGEAVPFFAFEYVPNAKTIIDYAHAHELGTRERMDLFQKVCEAVHHAHQKGIIHRDLKPGNILVDSSGRPKIIDFGVARATDSDMAVTTLQTDIGQLIGTLQYMSPEQCEADPDDIDTRSDVYALGVVMYELLCGQLPYKIGKAAVYEAARMIREQQPERPSTIDRTLRGDVETIALKTLEKDRNRRYQSASELARDIERYLKDEPIEARPASVVYQIRMMARRNKGAFGAAAALLVGLILAIGGTTRGWVVSTRATETARVAQADEAKQRNIAETQQELAERRFNQVRELARIFMFDFYDEIKVLDGSTIARELLVGSALSYLEGLRKDVGDDPELLREMADAYNRVGDVLGGIRSGNLGQDDEALQQYRTALEIRQQIAAIDPNDIEDGLDVMMAQLKVGDMIAKQNDFADALERYTKAEATGDRLRAIDPQDDAVNRQVAIVAQKIGDMHVNLNNMGSARENYEKALAIKRLRIEENPDDSQTKRDLTTAQIKFGNFLEKNGDPAAGLEFYQQALATRQQMFELEPTSGRYRRDVILASYYVGYCFIAMENFDSARQILEQVFDETQRRFASDPVNARARSDMMMLLNAVVVVSRELDHSADAMAGYENSLLILEEAAAEDPNNKNIFAAIARVRQVLEDAGKQ